MVPLLFGLGFFPLLIIVAVSIIITVATEFDSNGYATGSLAIGTGVILWLAKVNPLPWIIAHLGVLALGVIGYFVVGIVWGFFKWYLFNHDIFGRINRGTLELKTNSDGTHFVYLNWRGSSSVTVPLDPSDSRSRILGWMTYWPWSIMWFILNDPVRRAWNAIYNLLASKLKAVSNHVFKNLTINKNV